MLYIYSTTNENNRQKTRYGLMVMMRALGACDGCSIQPISTYGICSSVG